MCGPIKAVDDDIIALSLADAPRGATGSGAARWTEHCPDRGDDVRDVPDDFTHTPGPVPADPQAVQGRHLEVLGAACPPHRRLHSPRADD